MSGRAARGLALAVGAMALAASGLWWAGRGREFVLPPELEVEELLQDLSTGFEQHADPAVRLGGLQPSPYLDGNGGYRRAVIAPPPSAIHYTLTVPPGAALRLAAGVARDPARDRNAAGVRFEASVDGRIVFSRALNPARSRHHRRWFEDRIDLGAVEGRTVDVALTTRVEGSGAPAGTAGWSNLRLVRVARRERLRASPDAPSVLVLLVDALRADRLGCYGAAPSPSPTLDALAARGLVFEHAVAQSSWTMPAVTTILTGLYPRSHGVVGGSWAWGRPAGVDEEADWAFLSDTIRTMATEATAGGVTTVGVAGNPTISRGTNLARGFETFVELTGKRTRTRWARAADVTTTFLRWLAPNRGRRFLGYLHYMDAHSPYAPPEPFRPAPPPGVRPEVRRGDVDKFQHAIRCGAPLLGDDEIAYLRALYDGGIRYWDDELARLLRGLDDLGVRDSTIVVVTADHGEEFQEHGRLEHGTQLYDETLRVPLVIVGAASGASRVTEQAEQIDLFPTVAAMLGLPPVAGLPGRNLLAAGGERPVFSETRYGTAPGCKDTELLSVRTAAWKLIHTPALGRYELYDLARDPAERTDRFGMAPEGPALAEQLATWWATLPPPPPPAGRDPRLGEKLRALGYVQ